MFINICESDKGLRDQESGDTKTIILGTIIKVSRTRIKVSLKFQEHEFSRFIMQSAKIRSGSLHNRT